MVIKKCTIVQGVMKLTLNQRLFNYVENAFESAST